LEDGSPEGVYLTDEGRKRFFAHYEERMQAIFGHPRTNERTAFRKLLLHQAQAIARAVMEGVAYESFLIE